MFSILKPSAKAARIYLDQNHIYSVLAHNSRLSLILPTGKTRWSTLTQKNLERYLKNSSKNLNINNLDLESLLEMGFNFVKSEKSVAQWRKGSTHSYRTVRKAIKKETRILDSIVEELGMSSQYQ